MKCPRCQQENPTNLKFCGECAAPLQEASPTAESYADLKARVERLTGALSESLEQQTATGEILRVIASSPTDLQPVLDAVAQSAARLCDAYDAGIFRVDGNVLRLAAHHGPLAAPAGLVVPLIRGSAAGRAVIERRTFQVADLQAEVEEFPEGSGLARRFGYRTTLNVPLVREGVAIGVIVIRRSEVRPFAGKQVELVTTFADQAVIAIENVRLFNETKEALERQTATAEILRVISQSPTDVQPVFDAVVERAARLCGANDAAIFRVDGDNLTTVATYGAPAVSSGPLSRRSASGCAILDRRPVHIDDLASATAVAEFPNSALRARGVRTQLAVPLLKEDEALGVILIRRFQVQPFSEQQIALVRTFADQAVIAIENMRLFKELEARNRDLTEALEQQTATGEILHVISSSPTDLGPVLEAVVENAARLCEAPDVIVSRIDGNILRVAARHGPWTSTVPFPETLPITRNSVSGRAVIDRRTVHVHDLSAETDEEYSVGKEFQRRWGHRTILVTPLLSEGIPLGVIGVFRTEVRTFSDAQIKLLETFAHQAAIAIENVRLFTELQARTGELTQSVEKLTALGEVSQAVSSTLDIEMVLDTIVSRATQLAGADGCAISEYDDSTELFHVRATHGIDATLIGTLRAMPLRKGEGVMGRAAETREPIQMADIAVPGAYQSPLRDVLIGAGFRAVLSVPLLREEQIIGSLSLSRKAPGEFPPEVIEVLNTFATQSALAIQNARLFHEIEVKSRQLEAASRHKSEFLANMSHELRTPLNAIIGFSEVLSERMFGDLNDKQEEYLKDIYSSGQHLLSLINDILDLSKIEAGRMELEVTDFDLPSAIDNALILVRERASRRGITLGRAIDDCVGLVGGDERKVKQVLLNLLSNALKFTPEGGRIDVRAALNDGMAEVSVADTGVGIAPEDQEAIFEEFRQVGTADKKVEGTGLGLALSRKFIELHGGRIWVKSQTGKGSTFTFTLPAT